MSLLDDLVSIDLSSITDARSIITSVLDTEQVRNLIDNGAIQSAMGSLGSGFSSLQTQFSDSRSFLEPLVNNVVSFSGSVSTDSLPVADYIQAVSDGAAIILSLLEGIDDDPAKIGKLFGFLSDTVLEKATSVFEGYTNVDLSGIGRFRGLLDSVERGVPRDPALFAELALDILVPIPRSGLQQIRSNIDTILHTARDISFPSGRNAGLLDALHSVTLAAQSGNSIQLNAALTSLQTVRAGTLVSVTNDLENIVNLIDRLPIDTLLEPLQQASAGLNRAELGIMEFLQTLEKHINFAQNLAENFDADDIRQFLDHLIQLIEQYCKTYIVDPIDAQVKKVEDWIRGLLSHIPLTSYRAKITDFILSIAQAIDDADLDRPAREIRSLLNTIENAVDPTALKNEIESILGNIESVFNGVLDQIIGALSTIHTAVTTVSSHAQSILERVADAIRQFRELVDQITVTLEQLGIEEAGQQVVEALANLRKAAESLLTVAPLPDSLRPMIEQLISAIENIDLDAVLDPAKAAAEEFKIPESVSSTINEALQKASDCLKNLIPDQLITDIEAEVENALEELKKLDPAELLASLDEYVDQAKTFLEGIDPRPIAQEIRGPFQTVLDTFDNYHPLRLLEPVIEAYDSLLGNIPFPEPEQAVRTTSGALNSSFQSLSNTFVERVGNATGAQPVNTSSGPGESSSSSPSATPAPNEETVKPGDVIRLIGYVPKKLREALVALNESAAGDVLGAIDRLCAGLARDIRSLQAVVWEIEHRIQNETHQFYAPLAKAQMDAQLAISMNFSSENFNVQGSCAIVAQCSSGMIRNDLHGAYSRFSQTIQSKATRTSGQLGAKLDSAASALERCSLSGLTGDIDSLLAALDVEPIAQKIDNLVFTIIGRTPALLTSLETELQNFVQKLRSMLTMFNPAYIAQKFMGIINIFREQLETLDPRRLAMELGEIHKALRDTIAAYDPALFAEEIYDIIERLVQSLELLKPSELLSGFSFSDDFLDKIKNAVPTEALKDIDRSLDNVGNELAQLDPSSLLEAVNTIAPRLVEQFDNACNAIKNEILTLLKAIQYQQSCASASVSVTVS